MIDITFDFRSDARGRDPDAYSPTLNAYHKILWSKELPNGEKNGPSVRAGSLCPEVEGVLVLKRYDHR